MVTKSDGKSVWLTTNLGVPQGSVLGTLLFKEILFNFNGPNRTLSDDVAHLLYADDLQTRKLLEITVVGALIVCQLWRGLF